MASSPKKPIDESHCVVCRDDIEFSACGACDHPICLKCCVKLRLLRKENDCPVCRSQLKEVIVSKGYKSWSGKSLRTQPRQHLRNFGIYHETQESQIRVNELLQHKCPICKEIFKTFPFLKDHVKRAHMSFYCDICLRHLRIFTHERKCYTREALVKHRRCGDIDDKSHRGHPACKFCDDRYLDNDELLGHLRKNHFWCHLCEKDGSQDYFPHYKELRVHFRESHFLCEEGGCLDEKFTSVFRVKIDYQAHKAQKHSDKLSKAEARLVRQVDIAITFTPRQVDSINVVSSRDYSFPEQRNEQHGGRRPGNRERAIGVTSGFGGQDSFVREGSDRPVRSKARDRDRAARNPELEKDRDNGRAVKGSLQDNARDTATAPRDTTYDRRKDKDFNRTSRNTQHDQWGNKDAEGTSRDSQQDKRRDHEKLSRDENHGKKLNDDVGKKLNDDLYGKKLNDDDGIGNRNAVVTSKGVEPILPQASADHEKSKSDVTGEGGSACNKNTTTGNKVPDIPVSDSAPEQDKLNDKVSKLANPGVNGKVNGKGTKNYNADYPALAQMKIQPQGSIAVQPVPSYEQQYPTLTTKNNNADYPALAQMKIQPQGSIAVQPQGSIAVQPVPSYEQQYPTLTTKNNNAVGSSTVKTPAPKRTYQNEFPTLSANGNGKSRNVPPGVPPPGFQSPRQPSVRPPPGMKWHAPPNLAPAYETAGDVSGRNQKLIQNIRYILNNRGQSFQRFREISGLFRNGLTSAESYYRECCGLLGEQNIHTVFRELIGLLPDEEKQRQLLSVYNDAKIRAKQMKPADAGGPVAESRSENDVGMSKGVVSLQQSDFPALPISSGKRVVKSQGQKSGAWVRGR